MESGRDNVCSKEYRWCSTEEAQGSGVAWDRGSKGWNSMWRSWRGRLWWLLWWELMVTSAKQVAWSSGGWKLSSVVAGPREQVAKDTGNRECMNKYNEEGIFLPPHFIYVLLELQISLFFCSSWRIAARCSFIAAAIDSAVADSRRMKSKNLSWTLFLSSM